MPLVLLSDLPDLEIAQGIHAHAVTAENVTVLHVRIDKGALLPEHAHVNEQVINVIDGQLKLTVQGETHILEPGKVMVLPSNVPHSGKALTDVKVVDVFYPVREDFRGSKFDGYPGDPNR